MKIKTKNGKKKNTYRKSGEKQFAKKNFKNNMKRKKNSHSNAVKELPSTANASSNHIEKPIIIQKPNPSPSIDQVGVIGGDGYEWINFPPNSQTNFYRAPGDKEWILWEN